MTNGNDDGVLSSYGLKQYSIPVEVKKLFLTACKSPDIDNPRGVDPHALKRWAMSHRGDYQVPIILKANEAAIKEMVNIRGQQQAVLAVQPLIIC